MHVLRGLRQAAVLLAGAVVVAAVAGGLWAVLRDDGFRVPFAVALMAAGFLLSATGGTLLGRVGTTEARAFLGMGPSREEAETGDDLTGFGIFLFVALPLFLAGLALFDLA